MLIITIVVITINLRVERDAQEWLKRRAGVDDTLRDVTGGWLGRKQTQPRITCTGTSNEDLWMGQRRNGCHWRPPPLENIIVLLLLWRTSGCHLPVMHWNLAVAIPFENDFFSTGILRFDNNIIDGISNSAIAPFSVSLWYKTKQKKKFEVHSRRTCNTRYLLQYTKVLAATVIWLFHRLVPTGYGLLIEIWNWKRFSRIQFFRRHATAIISSRFVHSLVPDTFNTNRLRFIFYHIGMWIVGGWVWFHNILQSTFKI